MNALPGLCLSSSSSSSSSSLTPPYLSSSSSYSSSFARTLDIRFLLAFKNATLFPPLSPFVPFSLPPSLPSSLPPSCPPSLRRTLHRPLSCFLYLPSSPLLLFQRCFLSLLSLPLSQSHSFASSARSSAGRNRTQAHGACTHLRRNDYGSSRYGSSTILTGVKIVMIVGNEAGTVCQSSMLYIT